jgi:DNA-binding NtrC family response regulator
MTDKATILFVDDEERILRSLKMLFKGEYDVVTTTNGETALEYVKRHPVHVVVSDQRMPGMLGVELLRLVKAASPDTMRVLLTGYSDLSAIVGSVNEGEIFRFVNKPWSPQDIKETVGKAARIAKSLENIDRYAAGLAAQGETVSQPGLRFLVVDDDPTTVDTVKAAVGGDHIVEWGPTLERALEILNDRDVAIVVSELRLGTTDITGVIKTLKRYNPALLTVVVTSFEDTTTLIDLINQGQVYRFLPKPLRQGLLEMSLQSTLRQYHSLRDDPRLAARFVVEPAAAQETDHTLSNRIMGYIRRIRSRGDATALGVP